MKNELNGYMYNFSVGYDTINAIDIENIRKCLMEKQNIVQMPGFTTQTPDVLVFLLLDSGELLTIKCISINNQQCIVRPTLIGSNGDELRYYSFIANMDRLDEGFNTVDRLFGRIWTLIKQKTLIRSILV